MVIAEDTDPEDKMVIAEDTDPDDKMVIDEEEDRTEDERPPEAEPKPGPSKAKEEGIIGREELTKELLKTIVSTLEPSEAAKLLVKASQLEKLEKLSLDQLKDFLFSKEDENPPKPGKKIRKATKKKTPVPAKSKAAPGTRRSGRLHKDDGQLTPEPREAANDTVEEASTVAHDPSSESETETFVIEPKERCHFVKFSKAWGGGA